MPTLRRAASLVLVSACAAAPPAPPSAPEPAPAPALEPAPEPAPAPTQTHALEFEVSEEDECSQTFAAFSTQGRLALELDGRGGAALVYAGEGSEFWADKPGGTRTHDSQRARARWTGDALAEGDALRLHLSLAEQRCERRFPNDQPPPVAVPCTGFQEGLRADPPKGTLELVCRAGTVPLSRDFAGPPGSAGLQGALRCVPARTLPPDLERVVDQGALVFPDEGARFKRSRMSYDDRRWFEPPEGPSRVP